MKLKEIYNNTKSVATGLALAVGLAATVTGCVPRYATRHNPYKNISELKGKDCNVTGETVTCQTASEGWTNGLNLTTELYIFDREKIPNLLYLERVTRYDQDSPLKRSELIDLQSKNIRIIISADDQKSDCTYQLDFFGDPEDWVSGSYKDENCDRDIESARIYTSSGGALDLKRDQLGEDFDNRSRVDLLEKALGVRGE